MTATVHWLRDGEWVEIEGVGPVIIEGSEGRWLEGREVRHFGPISWKSPGFDESLGSTPEEAMQRWGITEEQFYLARPDLDPKALR